MDLINIDWMACVAGFSALLLSAVAITAVKHWARSKGKILKHMPTVWTIPSLIRSANERQMAPRGDSNYVPARPQANAGSLRYRIRCAYLAFTGRCDLVRWPADQ